MANNVSIKLGESAAAFMKRYPGAKVTRQPAGLDFYKIDWDTRPRGIVTIEHGKNTFAIEDVLGMTTSEDQAEFKKEGLFEYTIFAGISDPDLIPHDEARVKTYALLRNLMEHGWKPIVARSDPRISGRARFLHAMSVDESIGLDPLYVPTLDEWMQIPSRVDWMFYANGAYLDVNFTRERTLTDPNKPGSYLLTFSIKTETEYFRGFADPDNRLRWKEVVPQELVKVAALRAKKEAELRAEGVPIDESYQDPPVPSFK